jgi:hypothetical protein
VGLFQKGFILMLWVSPSRHKGFCCGVHALVLLCSVACVSYAKDNNGCLAVLLLLQLPGGVWTCASGSPLGRLVFCFVAWLNGCLDGWQCCSYAGCCRDSGGCTLSK